MEKTLKLGKKEYRLHPSLFTIIDYRNVFSTELCFYVNKVDTLSENFLFLVSTVLY